MSSPAVGAAWLYIWAICCNWGCWLAPGPLYIAYLLVKSRELRDGAAWMQHCCRQLLIPDCRQLQIPDCRQLQIPDCRQLRIPDCRQLWIPDCRQLWIPDCRQLRNPDCRQLQIPDCRQLWIPNALLKALNYTESALHSRRQLECRCLKSKYLPKGSIK